MRKVLNILIGWGKAMGVIRISTAEQKLSELRLHICKTCEYSEDSKILRLLNDNAFNEHSLKCTKCGCPCLEKSLVVEEKCPVKKW
jgi:hypothetical protein